MIVDAGIGPQIYKLVKELFPICRSLTGDGVRQTLHVLQQRLPGLTLHEVPSGTECFDWTVPREWNIREAYVEDPTGRRIVDFREHNLHVVGYSVPVDSTLPLSELQSHLHSLPDRPHTIPYITSYYQERWGFCLTDAVRQTLRPGNYRVRIDSELKDGNLTYGEFLLPGETEREIFISTYICHPSMANNELSGPTVTLFLARWLLGLKPRRYSYRVVFIPETIGSIVYLSRNLAELKRRVEAGFVVTCVGDDRSHSYLPSRAGDTLADVVAQHVLRHLAPDFKAYPFLDRGSDERQYCSPGVDLPMASLMRSKYGTYPEYHTSDDNLTLVSPAGLAGGFGMLQRAIECLEMNTVPNATVFGEPQLGKRGLYPTLSTLETRAQVRAMMNLLAYADGKQSLLEIAEIIGEPVWRLRPICDRLASAGLLRLTPPP
jgi:aminopeptidase-like protein